MCQNLNADSHIRHNKLFTAELGHGLDQHGRERGQSEETAESPEPDKQHQDGQREVEVQEGEAERRRPVHHRKQAVQSEAAGLVLVHF